MDEFTDIGEIALEDLATAALTNFGERYSADATRVLNTGILLPGDGNMIQLALAITMGMYMRSLVENKFSGEVQIH